MSVFFLCHACSAEQKPADNGAFSAVSEHGQAGSDYDLSDIQHPGEFIVATLSGPDTYYDYQGQPMGMQYALAADFARREGLRIRVEAVRDTAELFRLLASGEADIIACPLPESRIRQEGFRTAGMNDRKARTAWAVRPAASELADALDRWYAGGVEVSVRKAEQSRYRERRQVRRKVRAPYVSKEKGIISTYDDYFRSAAASTGWDWRLIAAQCYQESGFDPNAVSWAGARGLMQIMPATAQHLGLAADRMYSPADNISAAAKYIRELNGQFSEIRSREERIKFVLAAYNGGAGHVRDAMALARKYGKNPTLWADVSPYVLGLSQPRYYRDPVVRHGYMIGSETANYVTAVLDRWRAYGGRPEAGVTWSGGTSAPVRSAKSNRFTRDTRIYRPDEPEFNKKPLQQ